MRGVAHFHHPSKHNPLRMAFKIYTKTGDDGTTGTFGGERRRKHDPRIEAYGTVDELNAVLGQIRDATDDASTRAFLLEIQSELFTIGSYLATPGGKADHLPPLPVGLSADMERHIDRMEAELPPLKNFILPGGHPTVSLIHVGRTVARRAERRVTELNELESVQPEILRVFNRLSDYLFVLARWVGKELGIEEIAWRPRA